MPRTKLRPTWNDVKTKLAGFDRAELLQLVQDLYAARKENQTFLHARFDLGEEVLVPYMKTIQRWIAPDPFSKNQDISVSRAKQAVADYRKAIGQPVGLLELMVFYCEEAALYSAQYGLQDEVYFNALVRMFEQAAQLACSLSADQRGPFVARLHGVRDTSQDLGYGVGDDMDELLAEYDLETGEPEQASTG